MTFRRSAFLLLALLVAWTLMLFTRGPWTPDEPRELALAASQVGEFSALPSLGGRPFTEKPPLAYWISAASMRILDVNAPAARLPLLVFAITAIGSVYLLGRRLGNERTGVMAALLFSTGALVFDTQIWLATDALLLASVTLALSGMHLAFGEIERRSTRTMWTGCVLMHAGLMLALFTKNLGGWLVPVSALCSYLLWQRRLRDLLHPAAWIPLLLSGALFVLWARDVAAMHPGSQSLHALFWDNLAGRFGSYGDTSASIRALGHRNWPGKYLVELPLYLLPWTPLLCAAVFILWRDRTRSRAWSGSIRFALCACVPALAILSLAATSRGVYAAPVMPGIALLVAIVFTVSAADASSVGVRATSFRCTTWIVLLLDGGLLVAALVLQMLGRNRGMTASIAAMTGFVVVVALCVNTGRKVRAEDSPAATAATMSRLAGAHITTLIALGIALVPVIDRGQDLARAAAVIEQVSNGRPLILWQPDETTLAMSDLYLRKPACTIVEGEAEAEAKSGLIECLRTWPVAAVVALTKCPAKVCGLTRALSSSEPVHGVHLAFPDAAVGAAHVRVVDGIERLGGRTYLVGFLIPESGDAKRASASSR